MKQVTLIFRVLAATIALALTAVMCGLWVIYLTRGPGGGSNQPTPTLIIWTPTPVPTVATATPTPTPTEAPTLIPTPPAGIAVGRYVRVAGTGGAGLNLREGPGANYPRKDVASEGEVFIVVEGPVEAGEFTWWKIRDHKNSEREWWAAGNFLEPIEHP
ncbi:MAG: SH3 domain-containing protein [Anaerolineae bacterium]|nr:SH3 domain-containing protein [Anaerolineae bacterium]